MQCDQLKSGKGYTLDYDNVVIETEKQDARYSYKKTRGYHPGFAFVGHIPVHIQNRNGNTPASFEELLEESLYNLEQAGITVSHYRTDNALYQKDVIDMLDDRPELHFYIRMLSLKSMRQQFPDVKDWQGVDINYTHGHPNWRQ